MPVMNWELSKQTLDTSNMSFVEKTNNGAALYQILVNRAEWQHIAQKESSGEFNLTPMQTPFAQDPVNTAYVTSTGANIWVLATKAFLEKHFNAAPSKEQSLAGSDAPAKMAVTY